MVFRKCCLGEEGRISFGSSFVSFLFSSSVLTYLSCQDDSEVAGPVGSGIILTGINHVEGNDADGLCDTYNWGKGDGGNGADGCPIWD